MKQNNVPRVREVMLETFSLQSEVINCFSPLPLMVCPLIKNPTRLSCNAELVANTSSSSDLFDHRVLRIPHEQATVVVTINHVNSGSIHMVKKRLVNDI